MCSFYFQTAPDPTVSIQPPNQPWCIIILYVGSDVTAVSYSGAPQHNTHMLTVVKVLSRRDGAGSAVERFLRPALKGNGEMCSVDIAGHVV